MLQYFVRIFMAVIVTVFNYIGNESKQKWNDSFLISLLLITYAQQLES